ncbi:MAG: superinfection immunity protein [Candidatus Woesearchaeota archaeon]|nr:superinfection immunity protein [Candidatus Woesearchaeota archaeon]
MANEYWFLTRTLKIRFVLLLISFILFYYFFQSSGPFLLMLLITAIIYFIPSIIGYARHKKDAETISILNFLLGWTIIGWFATLIWSLKSDKKK